MAQGDVESLAYSCYQPHNSEAFGHLWRSQLDVYTSTRLDVDVVMLYSEVPGSCSLLDTLAQYATLWGSGAEHHR